MLLVCYLFADLGYSAQGWVMSAGIVGAAACMSSAPQRLEAGAQTPGLGSEG